MLLQDKHTGSGSPFEGDLTLWLRSLPAGASVTKASITLEQTGFEEVIDFGNQATFGATKISDSSSTFVEVDFHARRTLVSIEGSVTGTGPNLQVDMGGTYIAIAKDGTFMGPGHPDPFPVTFSSGVAPLPGLTVSKFRLFGASDTRLTVSRVHIRSFPTNVSVRLGQLPAFWTRPGELAAADTSPDFAAVLNAVLATAQPQNGFYAIPFVIHSDTLAQLEHAVHVHFGMPRCPVREAVAALDRITGKPLFSGR